MAPPFKPLRVIITGSSGFTGQALLRRLAGRGHVVVGLTRTPEIPEDLYADLLDQDSLAAALDRARPDVVVHLAGISTPLHASVAEIYAANVVGTTRLLDSIMMSGHQPSKVIVSSSATVYQTASDGALITEDHSIMPDNHYANSKWCVEEVCRLSSLASFIQIVRPFNYTGPGQSSTFFVPKVVEHFRAKKRVLEVGNLNLVRDISALDDALEAYTRLIEVDGLFGPLNLCSGQGVQLSDLVQTVERLSGHTLEIRQNPAFVRRTEPQVVIGSRKRLDAAIGSWNRVHLETLIQAMLSNEMSSPLSPKLA